MLWKAFYPRAEAATRLDLADLEHRVSRKADKEALDTALATKVGVVRHTCRGTAAISAGVDRVLVTR